MQCAWRRLIGFLLTCRLFEWVMTFIMLGMACTIVYAPETIGKSAFRYMLVIVASPLAIGMFFWIVGAVRVVALLLNGHSPLWGPRLRAIGALGGALIWAWMAVALIYLTNDTGSPSLGIFNWVGLAAGEIISCARAGADVRTNPGR